MHRFLFAFFFSFLTVFAYTNPSLKERLLKAKPGDYIVTAQGSSYSVLLLRSSDQEKIILEEISIDQENVDLEKISWKKWVENKAPAASAWIAYVIDLDKNTLSQCFSHLHKQWLFLEKSDYIFGKLLTLNLSPTREFQRKRIGPPPVDGEVDRRKMWAPPLILEGKKQNKPQFEVVRTIWPSDKTRLSGCVIELYLDASHPQFPFPYWIEVQSAHYTLKVRTIDSGAGMKSSMPLIQ